MKLSKEMRRVLRFIERHRWAAPMHCRCNYRTYMALERRGLIRVGTTFASIVSPHNFAEAVITDAGQIALKSQ